MTSGNSVLNFILYYSIGWMTKGYKCKRCIKKIKMKNHIMTNTSLCLLIDDSEDVVFTWFLFIRWAKIRIDTRKKMAREEKHWKVGNSNIPYLIRRMGSCDCPTFSIKVKSKWKTYWLLCFARLTTRKLKRKEMCKKHSQ